MAARLTLVDGLDTATRDRLRALTTPRRPCGPTYSPQTPHPKQQAFLCLQAREALFGGAAGGGKSSALLLAALQYVCVPKYRALLLRQTFPQLEGEEGLISRAKEWMGPYFAGAGVAPRQAAQADRVHYSEQRHRLTFPSSATITFGHLQHDRDKHQYQGLAFQFTGWDELTHWADSLAYRYVSFSRSRKPRNLCRRCNGWLTPRPGHPGQFDHVGCPECGGTMTGKGSSSPCSRHVPPGGCAGPLTTLDCCPGCGLTVADVPLRTRAGTNPGGRGHAWVKQRFLIDGAKKGRIFLPSRIEDNPSLDEESYVSGLQELDPVERARMLLGDWDVAEGGSFFNRDWFISSTPPFAMPDRAA